MAVEVTTNAVFQAGVPRALFKGLQSLDFTDVAPEWDLTADGKRFLFALPVAQNTPAPFTVVLNWQTALKK
jgi:hypothetical protein